MYIETEEQYEIAMEEINVLFKIGFDNLNREQETRLDELCMALDQYEDKHFPLPNSESCQ